MRDTRSVRIPGCLFLFKNGHPDAHVCLNIGIRMPIFKVNMDVPCGNRHLNSENFPRASAHFCEKLIRTVKPFHVYASSYLSVSAVCSHLQSLRGS